MDLKRCLPIFILLSLAFICPQKAEAQKVRKVVIDAGHGGHDPGAVGRASKEKDITLSIALKTGKYIEENLADVQVVYTRKTDVFVELYKRAKIANEAKADLFISIHCNANKSSSPYGAETYVMGLHRSEANLAVAQLENAAILLEEDYHVQYDGFDPNSPEGNIFFSMLQNAYLDQSLSLASNVQRHFKDRVNLFDRGVKQAGFLVLYKTTMPSVLIETGFISNQKEEKLLASEEGQNYIASAIFRAIKDYKKSVEKPAAPLLAQKDINTDVLVANKNQEPKSTDAKSTEVKSTGVKPKEKSPETKSPETKSPEVKTPEVIIPESKTSAVVMPEMKSPAVKQSDVVSQPSKPADTKSQPEKLTETKSAAEEKSRELKPIESKTEDKNFQPKHSEAKPSEAKSGDVSRTEVIKTEVNNEHNQIGKDSDHTKPSGKDRKKTDKQKEIINKGSDRPVDIPKPKDAEVKNVIADPTTTTSKIDEVHNKPDTENDSVMLKETQKTEPKTLDIVANKVNSELVLTVAEEKKSPVSERPQPEKTFKPEPIASTSGNQISDSKASEISDTSGNNILNENEIANKEAKPSFQSVVFKVQFLASKTLLDVSGSEFKGLKDVSYYFHNGIFKYTYGNESTYEKASMLAKEIDIIGFNDCFIVAFKGDERITVEEAIRLQGK